MTLRRYEKVSDYKTLTQQSIKREMIINLDDLVKYLNDHLDELSRQDAVKISVTLNNLMLDLEK